MRLNYIANALGLTMIYIGFVVLIPVIVALYYKDYNSIQPFITAALISCSIGYLFRKFIPNATTLENLNDIKKAEALFIVALSWIIFGIISAIPYLFYGLSPLNSIFESVSGITTTGATILTHYNYPQAFFFWRSLTQWLGGLGIIVLFIAILPQFAVAGRQMFFAEAPGPTEDKFTPRIRNTASALWKIYAGLTVIQIILLVFGGMSCFDAICNSFSTLAAGGFSPNPESIMGYHSNYITWVTLIFMFLAGASFNIQYRAIIQKNPLVLLKNEEFKLYFSLVILMALLITISLIFNTHTSLFSSFTHALYQVISITTSTGSASADFITWDYTSKILLFIVMFMGSCAGSAGGGIKMVRWLIVYKCMKSELLRILHPNAIVNIKVDNKTVAPEVARQIIVYVFYYFLIFGITSIIISIIEHNSTIGLSCSITGLGNIGPGFAKSTGPIANFDSINPISKIIMIFNMMVGRLELIPFMVMLQKDFWTLKDN